MKDKHKDMPEKLNNALEWIVEFMLDNSMCPTADEMANGLNVSVGTARAYVKEMAGRKMIDLNATGFCLGIMIPGVYYLDDRKKK